MEDPAENKESDGVYRVIPHLRRILMESDKRRRPHAMNIIDNLSSLEQITHGLREAGLESSNLILGIDFTKSNELTGKYSFKRRSLHAIGDTPNPYEQAISIIGRTLSPFNDHNMIPCFGFGDSTTHDDSVFSFNPNHRPCHGFEEVLRRYREILPCLKLSGPTSFAPIIDAATDIVAKSGQYHVLVIIADGQVTRSADVLRGRFSPQEQTTVNSIVAASHYPLSILLVGVGDGPWEAMQEFDDNIPQRVFDNFQFVNFTKIMSNKKMDASKKEVAFALGALMEIPSQYKATKSMQVNRRSGNVQRIKPLPPPHQVLDQNNESVPRMASLPNPLVPAPPVENVCPICLNNPKDMAFGCGHLTCKECGAILRSCPLCRKLIKTRIRLFL